MNYASLDHRTDGDGMTGRAARMDTYLAVAKEAVEAGDTELASILRTSARLLAEGFNEPDCVLALRDGRRFPQSAARANIKRAGRPAAVAGGSPLARQMTALSAKCRKLASEADQARVSAVLHGAPRTPAPARFVMDAAGRVFCEG